VQRLAKAAWPWKEFIRHSAPTVNRRTRRFIPPSRQRAAIFSGVSVA
jgi:hypothetical protein